MKKDKLLTIFFVMCIVLLVSLSLVSVSYARYRTNSSSQDSAKVAGWGVEINTSSPSIFEEKYYKGNNQLVVSSTSSVVAPGTSGTNSFTITGTPEVSSMFIIDIEANSDVFLKSGTYLNLTTDHIKDDVFLIPDGNDYYPITYTLEVKEGTSLPVIIGTGKLRDIENALIAYQETHYKDEIFSPGTDLNTTFTISWRWASNLNNNADTWLGVSNARGVEDAGLVLDTDYSFTIDFDFIITVIQVN